ncbi:Centrosomal protein of 85 kDa [Channa argus]|uniref:Centrosomal protein of 85 kDa n=1 Tax=Channa argus TaxID=215402 RepID=A0A6G1PNK9_CHAAH|nr:Centrosomal protein of 85 kDa [Channa argus]
MTTSQRYIESKPAARFADMEWQTPAVSEKFQSRFGRRPGTADSGDTGLGTSASDIAEDFCSSNSSPSFQPIRSQVPIPTAHVMPSTAGAPASKPQSCVQEDILSSVEGHRSSSSSRTPSHSTSKSSSLSKSASSPNLDAQTGVGGDPVGPKSDCLSRYHSLVNGLDHSLFPTDHTRVDEGQRQKQHMTQLEQRLRESELQVHGALLGRGASYGDMCMLRLQEAQRENAFLRAQFSERTDCVVLEKAEAERRLGTVEAETRRLTESLKETCERHAEEMKKQEERIRSRDKHISNLKKKCQKEAELKRENQQRIETLERYLADLPTLEDYQNQNKQLLEVEQQAAQLQEKVQELEVCLEKTQSQLEETDTQLEEQKRRERDLLTSITDMQQRVQQGLEDGARLPSLDIEKLRGENNTLREEQQRLKKVIEKQHRMMEQLGSQIQALEVQLSQEESSSQALREEMLAKEQNMFELHTSMKELSAQNQELMEQNLTLQEQIGDLEQRSNNQASSALQPAGAHLTQRLHLEIASCLSDLRSLCSILTQRAQGQDPNLSLLLGLTSPPPVAEQNEDWMSPEVLQKKLVEAQQLRRDVEELRNVILDRYAQDMGENCITQ